MVKRAHEMVAARHLRSHQYDIWVPQMWSRRRINGDATSVRVPIFPGYLFANLALDDFCWHAINRTRGVQSMLTFGQRKPQPAIADLEAKRERQDKARDARRRQLHDAERVHRPR